MLTYVSKNVNTKCLLWYLRAGKNWKQLKYSSILSMLNKMCNTHTMEFYAAVNRKDLFLFVVTQTDLRDSLPGKVSRDTHRTQQQLPLSTWEERERG